MNRLQNLQKVHICAASIYDCPSSWRWDTTHIRSSYYNLWSVLRGQGEIRMEGGTFPVKSGSMLLLPPNAKLVAAHDPSRPLLVIAIHFHLGDVPALPSTWVARRPVGEGMDFAFISSLLNHILRLYNADQKERAELFLRAVLAEFFAATVSTETAEPTHAPMIWEICDRVHGSRANRITLAELAKHYGYSADYLGRLFQQVTGVSFSTYVANARVNQAKTMLAATACSINEIAEDLGYCDAAHFSRQFRQITGLSPSRYRREETGSNP